MNCSKTSLKEIVLRLHIYQGFCIMKSTLSVEVFKMKNLLLFLGQRTANELNVLECKRKINREPLTDIVYSQSLIHPFSVYLPGLIFPRVQKCIIRI
jgi:hypothetical protein